MKRYSLSIFVVVCSFIMLFTQSIYAHSGRTDSSGGHNCSAKSVSKGLCSGYHYHNSGSSTKTVTNDKSATKSTTSTKNTSTSSTSSNKKKDTYTESKVELYVNNNIVKLNNNVLLKDNANYFPIREVASAIGASIEFDSKTNKISITKNKLTTVIDSQSKDVINKNNTTYAAIRSIVSDLNIEVDFNAELNRINLKY